MIMNLEIKIDKVPGGFHASVDSLNLLGAGSTWAEAIGALIAQDPDKFGIRRIAYRETSINMQYRMERGVNQVIYDERTK